VSQNEAKAKTLSSQAGTHRDSIDGNALKQHEDETL
jgi:hypothetical protein